MYTEAAQEKKSAVEIRWTKRGKKLEKDLSAVQFIEKLRQKGLKVTGQRRKILDIILGTKGQQLSAEELYDRVRGHYPEIGLTTVYRTIQLFLELDVIEEVDPENSGVCYYQLNSRLEELKRRYCRQLICQECGRVYTLENVLLEQLDRTIEQKFGFQIVDHEVKLYGYCRECAEKRSSMKTEVLD